jgi:hypothetical protein
MACVSVEVPAELVSPIRETVLLLYGVTAESLHLSLKKHSEGRGSLDEVHRHRLRLAELDDLLGRLGWPAGTLPGPLELSAPRDLLHDTLYGALIDAGERLAQASNRCWRGELPLERVREAAEEVLALDALLRRLD